VDRIVFVLRYVDEDFANSDIDQNCRFSLCTLFSNYLFNNVQFYLKQWFHGIKIK